MNASLLKSVALGAVLLIASMGVLATPDESDESPLKLDQKAQADAGIVIATAGLRALGNELKAPGEVKADAYSTVLVSPRVPSQVLARKVKLGNEVRAGQPLVVLSSVEVAETQGALIVAEQDWQRIAALGAQAVSARRYNESKVQRDQARAKLRAYGLSDGQIGVLLRKGSAGADGSFELLSPTAGRITTDDFLVGERVDAGRTLFTVVEEESVWVVAQLAPADAASVKPGGIARILAHDEVLPGTVVQRGHQTDAHTRTAPVRIAVDNSKDQLHPGELVEVRIATGSQVSKLAIPAEAIVLMQSQSTVFVDRGNGEFEPVAVRTGETRDGWTVITDGIRTGERYVVKGAFALKARLLRSQLGEH